MRRPQRRCVSTRGVSATARMAVGEDCIVRTPEAGPGEANIAQHRGRHRVDRTPRCGRARRCRLPGQGPSLVPRQRRRGGRHGGRSDQSHHRLAPAAAHGTDRHERRIRRPPGRPAETGLPAAVEPARGPGNRRCARRWRPRQWSGGGRPARRAAQSRQRAVDRVQHDVVVRLQPEDLLQLPEQHLVAGKRLGLQRGESRAGPTASRRRYPAQKWPAPGPTGRPTPPPRSGGVSGTSSPRTAIRAAPGPSGRGTATTDPGPGRGTLVS